MCAPTKRTLCLLSHGTLTAIKQNQFHWSSEYSIPHLRLVLPNRTGRVSNNKLGDLLTQKLFTTRHRNVAHLLAISIHMIFTWTLFCTCAVPWIFLSTEMIIFRSTASFSSPNLAFPLICTKLPTLAPSELLKITNQWLRLFRLGSYRARLWS